MTAKLGYFIQAMGLLSEAATSQQKPATLTDLVYEHRAPYEVLSHPIIAAASNVTGCGFTNAMLNAIASATRPSILFVLFALSSLRLPAGSRVTTALSAFHVSTG